MAAARDGRAMRPSSSSSSADTYATASESWGASDADSGSENSGFRPRSGPRSSSGGYTLAELQPRASPAGGYGRLDEVPLGQVTQRRKSCES